jgi:hypothetical protein
MNSDHVRLGSLIALILTGVLAVGNITQVLPFLPPQYATLAVIVIVAVKDFLIKQVTPATNAQTPDNLPPKPPVSKS